MASKSSSTSSLSSLNSSTSTSHMMNIDMTLDSFNRKQARADNYRRSHNWTKALKNYNEIIKIVDCHQEQQIDINLKKLLLTDQIDLKIRILKGRCECLLELNKYDECVQDGKIILKLCTADQFNEEDFPTSTLSQIRCNMVYALYNLKQYKEAEDALNDWIEEIRNKRQFKDIEKKFQRYKELLDILSKRIAASNPELQKLFNDEILDLDYSLVRFTRNNLPRDKYSEQTVKSKNDRMCKTESKTNKDIDNKNINNCSNKIQVTNDLPLNLSEQTSIALSADESSSKILKKTEIKTSELLDAKQKITSNVENETTATCSFCGISFRDNSLLKLHCQTELHQKIVLSDEDRDWKYRTPSRGFTIDSYPLCVRYSETQSCYYGDQCVAAHGLDELNEWKERFKYRQTRMQMALVYGKSYTEILLEKWSQAASRDKIKIMREKVDKVEVICNNELVTSMISKLSKKEWVFTLKTKRPLIAVALLENSHRNNFIIKSIEASGCSKLIDLSIANDNNVKEVPDKDKPSIQHLKNNQEWVATEKSIGPQTIDFEHKVEIQFHTEIFGTFRQSVVFDFGCSPIVVKHLCVDVVVVDAAESEETKIYINSTAHRWDEKNSNLIKFEAIRNSSFLDDQGMEAKLLARYPSPVADTFILSESTITETLTQTNYRCRFHELLYIEEIARRDLIASYNLRTRLHVVKNYMFTPNERAANTVKYSCSDELFGLMMLDKDISEDTSAGRLILSNCTTVYLSTPQIKDTNKKRDVYEALIEDKCKNSIYIKLSAECVQQLNLKPDTDYQLDIQFQLNRLSYCERHSAIDKIKNFLIFPNTANVPSIPWSTTNLTFNSDGAKLNVKQKEAISIITTSLKCFVPPILLTGPFGSGKTYTLAQAIKPLLTQSETKILICTHSNSAADIYIKEYLHPWVEKGLTEATPLRIYYHKRWVSTVNHVVRKYCIIDESGNFQKATLKDIMKYRIVVATLSTSAQLVSLGLNGYFTHIFLDEAAQALECEAIIPLALATASTRIVLAGDHMQTNAELFSNFTKERKFHISLLERFYELYPSNFPCKILLCEIYRAHKDIINLTSELFYEQKLIASGKQLRHKKFYPLTFFTARGEDVQDKSSVAFYNNSEVYEIVERVCELMADWPTSWGEINESSIGIMTPYSDQVFRIRAELRKRGRSEISVERVLNVQGKQFRAVFISTVRTRRTCVPLCGSIQTNVDYGFLSNSKLLNTAITRAQSLVAVVGDPVALCSISGCRKIWERFIDICNQNNSFHGMPWAFLRSHLDWVEFKTSFLNPLAPEFVPKSVQLEAYLNKQMDMMYRFRNKAQNSCNTNQKNQQNNKLKNDKQQQNDQITSFLGLPLQHIQPTLGVPDSRMFPILNSNINPLWGPAFPPYPVLPIHVNPPYPIQHSQQNSSQVILPQNYAQQNSNVHPLPLLNIPNINSLWGGSVPSNFLRANATTPNSNVNGGKPSEKIPPMNNPIRNPINGPKSKPNDEQLKIINNPNTKKLRDSSSQTNSLEANSIKINANNTTSNIPPNYGVSKIYGIQSHSRLLVLAIIVFLSIMIIKLHMNAYYLLVTIHDQNADILKRVENLESKWSISERELGKFDENFENTGSCSNKLLANGFQEVEKLHYQLENDVNRVIDVPLQNCFEKNQEKVRKKDKISV